MRSGVSTEAGAETFPAESVRSTCNALPSITAGFSETLKLPSAPTTPVPITAPWASRTVTVVPGSPRPFSARPPALTTRSVGASGAVVSGGEAASGAVRVAGAEVLPAASVALTCKGCPAVCGGCSVTLKLPSVPATALPSREPSGPRTCTIEPASAVPDSTSPWGEMLRSVGGCGAVTSGAVTLAGSEVLPAASVRLTASGSPLSWGGSSGTWNTPSLPTVPLPSKLPAASRTFTVAPASPRPLTLRPSALTSRSVALAGAVTSESLLPPPPPPPPPAPAAAAAPPAPSKLRPAMAKVGVALPASPSPAISSSSEATSSKVNPVNASAS